MICAFFISLPYYFQSDLGHNPNLCWKRQTGSPVLLCNNVRKEQWLRAGQRAISPLPWVNPQSTLWGCLDVRPQKSRFKSMARRGLNWGHPAWDGISDMAQWPCPISIPISADGTTPLHLPVCLWHTLGAALRWQS